MTNKITITNPVLVEIPEPQFHYFGSTPLNWATGETVEKVLSSLARQAGDARIKQQVKIGDGLYAWTCRVEVPKSTYYQINFFQPQGVEVTDCREWNIKNGKGHVLPITRETNKDGSDV